MKIEGNFDNQLNKVGDKIKQTVEGSVQFTDLFTESFMRKNTKFSSIEEFFEQSSFEVKTAEDFSGIDSSELDSFVGQNTEFDSWESFSTVASKEYAIQKLKESGFKFS